jgi:hypothetical protein
MAPLADDDLAPFRVSCVFGACRRHAETGKRTAQHVNQWLQASTDSLAVCRV